MNDQKGDSTENMLMKAIVYEEYGPPDVLKLKEVEKPVPRDKEVLIRIHATPVSFGDRLVRNLKEVTPEKFHMPFLFWLLAKMYFGIRRPRLTVLGSEFSGEIEAVGRDVKRFKAGDPVFGYRGPSMGATASISACLQTGCWRQSRTT